MKNVSSFKFKTYLVNLKLETCNLKLIQRATGAGRERLCRSRQS